MPMPLAGCQNPIGLREMKWGEAVSMTALDEIKRGCVGEESLALLWTDSCPKLLGIVSGRRRWCKETDGYRSPVLQPVTSHLRSWYRAMRRVEIGMRRPMRSASSRVFKVSVAIEKIRHDLEHRLKKTDVVTGFTSEEPDALSLQCGVPLLLVLKTAILPS